MVASETSSSRQGPEGNLAIIMAEIRPWGFALEIPACEKLFLWHGEQDHFMPPAPAHLFAQALPHCKATFYPDEGHFSLLVHHAPEILRELSEAASPLKS